MAHHHGHHHEHHHDCHCHEHGCAHCEAKLQGKTAVSKQVLLQIALSATLFVVGLCVGYKGNVSAPWFFVAYAVVAWDILWVAAKNVCRGEVFDELFLMSVASIGAFCIGEYPEAVAVMLFYRVGETFQDIAVGKSRASIAALMDLRPQFATVVRNDEEVTVSPEEVEIGEMVCIKAGQKIPLDGIVLRGESTLDNSALTGESLPVSVGVGAQVLSGGLNLGGVLYVQVEKTYEDSTVFKILELVEHASEKKAKVERFITRFSRLYTPCVVAGALLLAILPPLFVGNFAHWVNRALVFLVISCPCALVVSVPLSFFGGIGGAARRGILVKGASALEMLAKVDTVVFDKTGTLTKGAFSLAEAMPCKVSREELLSVAAALEHGSNHPIARALRMHNSLRLTAEDIQEFSGKGLCGKVEGRLCFAGTAAFLQENGIAVTSASENGTTVYIGRENAYLGYLSVQDALRPEGKRALSELKRAGIRETVMLTGDRQETARSVGERLGIDTIYAELLPQDKVSKLEVLLESGRRVAVVGDGINDAPVLARGDVGIAMGGVGSDAAIVAADIVLMDDNLNKLPQAVEDAKKTIAIVRQNIVFALGAKAVILLLGALGIAGMWIAVFGDVGVMVLATLNALRSYVWKKSN